MRMKSFVGLVVVIGFIIWMTNDDDTFTLYPITKITKGRGDKPEWLPGSTTVYKIEGNLIISNSSLFLNKFENCTIFSIDNWECTYKDNSGSFGVKDGEYWQYWKRPLDFNMGTVYVSRFRYNIEGCKWDFYDGGLQVVVCPLRFIIKRL